MPQPQEVVSNVIQACVALYDNTAETPDELSFKGGDILTIIQQDSPGLEGWWICSLGGKQGICPCNRLRSLTEAEISLLGERRRRSWNTQASKDAVTPQKCLELGYLYDMPQNHFAAEGPQLQYDVPLSAQPLPGEESYDVPKRVGSLTPSSSISSLTTDSNRSSLIQQDYDVPRPVRLQPTQEEELNTVSYDVPRGGGDMPMELDSALDWLGRVESQVTSSTCRILACAGLHWRQPNKLEPRLPEVKAAVLSLLSSLHQLVLFVRAILLSQQDKGLGGKLSVLFENLSGAEMRVRDAASETERQGWSVASLGVEDETSHTPDALDALVAAAALLTDDIRQIASFVQGNSTLLFKKSTPMSNEDLSYMNLDKKSKEGEDAPLPPPIHADPRDRKILDFYTGQFWVTSGYLSSAIESFLLTVTQNQPPKGFLSQAKGVISWAHKLVTIGDALERNLSECRLKKEVGLATNSIGDATSTVVQKTKCAAVNFPNVQAVQFMVDAVVDLSHKSKSLKQVLVAH